MRPRFLVVSKYELRQYLRNTVDEAAVLLVVLVGFLMLMTPEVDQSLLPSSHKIYRVGYTGPTYFTHLPSYTLDFVGYPDKVSMMRGSAINDIDAFAIMGRNNLVFFSSNNHKSGAALSHVRSYMKDLNDELIVENIEKDKRLSGILLPIRVQVNEEEINYTAAINGSIEARRAKLLKGFRLFEDNEYQDGSGQSLIETARGQGREFSNVLDGPPPDELPSTTTDLELPSTLDVAFPFRTLYKNMGLLSPIILLSILISLSLSRERVDKNIENLFMSPLSKTEILLGKCFPYIVVMSALSLVYGLQASLSFEGLKATFVYMTLSIVMVSFSLFTVVISRSYRELTFIGSFGLFSFFFFIVLPNVFSGVNVLAFISPLDTITSIENGAVIPVFDLFLSTLPYFFLTGFFLTFTYLSFTPEVIFSSKSFTKLMRNFYMTLNSRLGSQLKYTIISVSVLVPFVFIIESIMAYLVLPMGYFAPVASVILLAFTEEAVKIIPFLYRRKNPVVYGITSGVVFFATEKAFNFYLIYRVYTYLGGPYSFFLKSFAPTLAVHVATTTLLAYVLSKSRRLAWAGLALFTSVFIHVLYNIMVMRGAI